jgi:ATP-binding cassette subfamily C protein LapB
MNKLKQLSWSFRRIAQIQGSSIDRLRLKDAESYLSEDLDSLEDVRVLCEQLDIKIQRVELKEPDRTLLPLLAYVNGSGWGVVTDRHPDGSWLFVQEKKEAYLSGNDDVAVLALIETGQLVNDKTGLFSSLIGKVFSSHKGVISEVVFASIFINALAVAVSLYTMQVYDRVIPTRSEETLIILTTGVFLIIVLEFIMKLARSRVINSVVIQMDGALTRNIFDRLLNVRVDQLSGSVGTLAGQIRGYEQVRGFLTASTLFTLVDFPMALLFIGLIAYIGTPLMAAAPAFFGLIAILVGLMMGRRINKLALVGAKASNQKTGLLVEVVEGVETIKAGSGGWKFLARWLKVSNETIHNDVKVRNSTESVQYIAGMLHQISYASIVVAGALAATEGLITMGALIACSILSGRILQPVMQIPNLLVQRAHSLAAVDGLEQLYGLESDHHGIQRPLTPGHLSGELTIDKVQFAYGEGPLALQVANLKIKQGDKVGVLGPIGAGKSTLLRLLSGMYRPQEGRILLDGLDLAHINRQVISQNIGYLQQDHRLFQGTLRENLLIGLPDPGDEVIHKALMRSGLLRLVSVHPQGLELPIFEGGKGLSGGQRQLVAFTRLLLCETIVLLLDEPTATMDNEQERLCLSVLQEELTPEKTLVLATHKPALLSLVDRLLVIMGNQIVMDGPRDEVLAQLAGNGASSLGKNKAVDPDLSPPISTGVKIVNTNIINNGGLSSG